MKFFLNKVVSIWQLPGGTLCQVFRNVSKLTDEAMLEAIRNKHNIKNHDFYKNLNPNADNT
jgi:hypothetical protein